MAHTHVVGPHVTCASTPALPGMRIVKPGNKRRSRCCQTLCKRGAADELPLTASARTERCAGVKNAAAAALSAALRAACCAPPAPLNWARVGGAAPRGSKEQRLHRAAGITGHRCSASSRASADAASAGAVRRAASSGVAAMTADAAAGSRLSRRSRVTLQQDSAMKGRLVASCSRCATTLLALSVPDMRPVCARAAYTNS